MYVSYEAYIYRYGNVPLNGRIKITRLVKYEKRVCHHRRRVCVVFVFDIDPRSRDDGGRPTFVKLSNN